MDHEFRATSERRRKRRKWRPDLTRYPKNCRRTSDDGNENTRTTEMTRKQRERRTKTGGECGRYSACASVEKLVLYYRGNGVTNVRQWGGGKKPCVISLTVRAPVHLTFTIAISRVPLLPLLIRTMLSINDRPAVITIESLARNYMLN